MAKDVNNPDAYREHRELARAVSELGDIEPEELFSLYAIHDVSSLDQFQRTKSAAELADNALSAEFRQEYPETAKALGNNTSTYDDEVEDELVTDTVMGLIMKARGQDPDNRSLAEAQRVRRSVLIFAMTALDKAITDYRAGSGSAA